MRKVESLKMYKSDASGVESVANTQYCSLTAIKDELS